MAIVFPRKLLIESDHDWNLAGTEMTPGRGTYSPSVSVRTDGGGFWMASLNNIRFEDESYTRLWRGLRQSSSNGVTPFVVPRQERPFAPFAGLTEFAPGPHSDGAFFDDGSGYYQPVINVVAGAAAPLRATSIYLRIVQCGALQGGEVFSIEHPAMGWRMYEIGTVEEIESDLLRVTFNPPLREAIAALSHIEFDRPRCTMKLLDSKAMDLNVTTFPFSLASVKFIESKFG